MQSTAKSVADYLNEVPAERKAALIRLRDLCRATLAGFEESMKYGGPSYSRNGEVEVGFASQKHFIGLYILKKDVMDAHRDLLTRFPHLSPFFSLLHSLNVCAINNKTTSTE